MEFKVYQIAHIGGGNEEPERYGLEFVMAFGTFIQAINWINNEGHRNRDYTIIEIYRKK